LAGVFYAMDLEIGLQVKFKDTAGEGRVARIEGERVWVEDSYGFEHEYLCSELLVAETMGDVGPVVVKDKGRKESAPAAQQVDRLTIDLHSHELMENTHGMTKYDILNHQIQKATDTIREAKRRKIPKVLIIHGKGSGRLQQEVHDLLARTGGVEYYFADFAEGGYGATEVRILANAQ